jgi:hypothetical protein
MSFEKLVLSGARSQVRDKVVTKKIALETAGAARSSLAGEARLRVARGLSEEEK